MLQSSTGDTPHHRRFFFSFLFLNASTISSVLFKGIFNFLIVYYVLYPQNNLDEIGVEMQQYTSMIESGCSTRLPFLLCGAFMPFCINGPSQDQPYVVPCREVCQQVRHDCRRQFHDAWGGLPWPSKLHCHRYPSHTSNYLQEDNTTVPCAMPPVGFWSDHPKVELSSGLDSDHQLSWSWTIRWIGFWSSILKLNFQVDSPANTSSIVVVVVVCILCCIIISPSWKLISLPKISKKKKSALRHTSDIHQNILTQPTAVH